MSATLHAHVKAAVEEQLAVARAAGVNGPSWMVTRVAPYTDLVVMATADGEDYTVLGTVNLEAAELIHIAVHDPAWAIAQHEAALERLEEHRPLYPIRTRDGSTERWMCKARCHRQPCKELRRIARAYSVPVDEEEPRG